MQFKYLFCFVFVFYIAQFAFAQTHIGINGGGGLNNLISLRAAIPLEFTFSKTFSLKTGVCYTQHHNPELLFLLSQKRDYRRPTLSYLSIPVLAKFRFAFTNYVNVYCIAGPQIGYAVRFSASYLEDEIFGIEKLDFKQLQINRFDLIFNAGIGVEKQISNKCKIYAELGYLLGLSDMDRRAANEIFNEGGVFSLGFMLPLSRK